MSHHGTRSSYSTPTQGNRFVPTPSAQRQQQQGATAGGGGGQQQPRISSSANRTINRIKWGQAWGGLSYLDPCHTNRLVLSLRSPLPSEIDWSIDRLLQVSGHEPDLLRLSDFPGLLDALISHIRAFHDLRLDERDDSHKIQGLSEDESKDVVRRRATEASLILRNLATENSNGTLLKGHKKLVGLITTLLEDGEMSTIEGSGEGEETTELRLYLLEVLEILAPTIPLALPGRSIMSTSLQESDEESLHSHSPEPPTSPSVRLYPILVSLTRSPDRALVLGAFRTLTALALHEANDAPLAYFTYTQLFQPLIANRFPHPLETAIELLPLSDLEISRSILDYIYQHTLVPANAISFSSRKDLHQVLKLISSKLHLGEKKELVEVVIPMRGGEGDNFWKSQTPRHARRLVSGRKVEVKEPEPKLTQAELDEILKLAEPARGLRWMRFAFEGHTTGEITQVALWTAYRAEFEGHAAAYPTERPMLAAAEVIKMSTEAFPNALPMVTDLPEKKFIIRGIRVRDRTDMRTVFTCRWNGCTSPIGASTPDELYRHIYSTHLSVPSPPTHCALSPCTYVTSLPATATPSQLTADLALHIRVHTPTYHPPPGYGPTEPLWKSGTQSDPTAIASYDRFHGVLDEAGDPTGLGLLSALVFRNVARTVRSSLGSPSGGASVASLTDGEPSIFESFARAAEGATRMDIIREGLEKVDYSEARRAGDVLVGMEEGLVETTLKDHGLSTMLGEVLHVILDVKRLKRKRKVVEVEE